MLILFPWNWSIFVSLQFGLSRYCMISCFAAVQFYNPVLVNLPLWQCRLQTTSCSLRHLPTPVCHHPLQHIPVHHLLWPVEPPPTKVRHVWCVPPSNPSVPPPADIPVHHLLWLVVPPPTKVRHVWYVPPSNPSVPPPTAAYTGTPPALASGTTSHKGTSCMVCTTFQPQCATTHCSIYRYTTCSG